MKFEKSLIPAILIKRYKRFLADVKLENNEIITVHCPNPGSMLGLQEEGQKCWISLSENKKRKLPYTLEMVEVADGEESTLVGINTNLPNKLAYEAITEGKIPKLDGYNDIKREVPYGDSSRIDLLLQKEGKPDCYVEVKNVTLMREKGLYEFPDCKTERGAKHLRELAKQAKHGKRAVMLYIIQRQDGNAFKLACDIDPNYNKEFEEAKNAGVEAYALACRLSVDGIVVQDKIPIVQNT